jgi:hypothetical protein
MDVVVVWWKDPSCNRIRAEVNKLTVTNLLARAMRRSLVTVILLDAVVLRLIRSASTQMIFFTPRQVRSEKVGRLLFG